MCHLRLRVHRINPPCVIRCRLLMWLVSIPGKAAAEAHQAAPVWHDLAP